MSHDHTTTVDNSMFGALFASGASKKKPVEVKRVSEAKSGNGVVKSRFNSHVNSNAPRTITTQGGVKRKVRAKEATKLAEVRRASVQRRSQSVHTPMFGSEDSESEDEEAKAVKRRKIQAEEVDRDREIRRRDAFEESANEGGFNMIHAAEIPALDKMAKFGPVLEELPEDFELELQYPSRGPKERFRLLQPLHDSHGFQAVSDIVETMHEVAANFLPEDQAKVFDDESTGFPQRLQRAIKKREPDTIKAVMEEWNSALSKLIEDGTVARVLDSKHTLSPALLERILNQAYSRTVSPNLKLLKKYQAGTDNVYGELLPKFVTKILKEDLRLKSNAIFVDLGSGVGNVVLQAALEVGCESWGCEVMKGYCRVADLQEAEFSARSRLWGLQMGQVHLEKGNFTENAAIKKILRKADAVLVNNQVFTPATNEALTTLFLDLKDGCKVVSLKSFVPADHKITARNFQSPYNLLSVEKKRYFSNCVSWTNEGGTYFISTKDSKRVENFLKKRHHPPSGESDDGSH